MSEIFAQRFSRIGHASRIARVAGKTVMVIANPVPRSISVAKGLANYGFERSV